MVSVTPDDELIPNEQLGGDSLRPIELASLLLTTGCYDGDFK